MICVDNSEWMRNGDYQPNRFQARQDSVNHLVREKIEDNQETTVGLLAMAQNRINVLAAPSRAVGKIMGAIRNEIQIGGQCDFLSALKVARLALKNRPNKNQRQRVIMFVGSPVEASTKELVAVAKNFKRNKVSVDIVNFGTENAENENAEKLEAFIGAVNSSDSSRLLNVPPGPHLLSTSVVNSLRNSEGAPPSGGVGGGVVGNQPDPAEDSDLVMAMRMSMEEERSRQRRVIQESIQDAGGVPAAMDEELDEDALLAQCIALSMSAEDGDVQMADLAPALSGEAPAQAPQEQQPQHAQQAHQPAQQAQAQAQQVPQQAQSAAAQNDLEDTEISAVLQDPDFISDLLDSVGGMDAEDLGLDAILSQLTGEANDKSEADKDKQKK